MGSGALKLGVLLKEINRDVRGSHKANMGMGGIRAWWSLDGNSMRYKSVV